MIRGRTRLAVILAIALCAMGVAASPAQAGSWTVLNKSGEMLKSVKALVGAEIEGEAIGLRTEFLEIPFELSCTSIELVNAQIEGEGKVGSNFKAKFTGCELFFVEEEEPVEGCVPKTSGNPKGIITTNSLKGELTTTAGGVNGIRIEPVGTGYATLEWGASCPIFSNSLVSGTLTLGDCEGALGKHSASHSLTVLESKIWLGSDTVERLRTSFKGSGAAFLTGESSGFAWGGTAGGGEGEPLECAPPPPPVNTWLALDPETEGKALEGVKAPLASKADSAKVTLLTHLLGLSLEIPCTTTALVGANLEAAGAITSGFKAKFTGCELRDSKTGKAIEECTAKTVGQSAGTMESNALKGAGVEGKTEGLVKVEAKEGTELLTLEFGGKGCLLAEKIAVNGTLYLKDGEGKLTSNLVQHLLEQGAGTELWVGAKTTEHLETSLDGSAYAYLGGEQTGLAWGASPSGGKAAWLVVDAKVAGALLEEFSAPLSGKAEGGEVTLLTHMVGLSAKIRCTAAELIGASVESKGKLASGFKGKFTGCEFLNTETGKPIEECAAKTKGAATGTIETNALKGELIENAAAPMVKIEPKEGTTFLTLEAGEKCLLAKEIAVQGVIYLADGEGTGETHLVEHKAKQGTGTELWVGSKTAEHLETSLDGGLLVSLGGEYAGDKWSGMVE